MSSLFLSQFVGAKFFEFPLGFLVRKSCFDIGTKLLFEFRNRDLVVSHNLELLSKLDGLVE